MAVTPSTMLPLGTRTPQFRLPDTTGKMVSLADLPKDKGYLVMFICNHCPYVKHVRDELAGLARDYQARGIAIVAINSNDIENYPDDNPTRMKEEVASAGYTFPYLYDETQEVAKAYKAACTPDFFSSTAISASFTAASSTARDPKAVRHPPADLRAVLDAPLAGKPIPEPHVPSMGCNIKWKPGNEPDYFHTKG